MFKYLIKNNKKIGIYIDFLKKKDIFFLIKKGIIKSLSFSMHNFFLNKKKFKKKIINLFLYLNSFSFNKKYILPHSSFYINLGHPFKNKIYLSRFLFIKEINFCYKLGIKFINFHPGNHLNKISEFYCINNIISSINYVIKKTKKVILILENTSGNGTTVCYSLEHISNVISSIDDKSRIGVCIDICHAFSSGYSFFNFKSCELFFEYFDKIIGLNYLMAIHLNGSKYKFNSRKDRHDVLKDSHLGNIIFYWIMRNKLFDNIPIILETIKFKLWLSEIIWLNSL